MRRRRFLIAGGLSVFAAHALAQGKKVSRVGLLLPFRETDNEVVKRVDALKDELNRLGWHLGSNLELKEFWPGDDMEQIAQSSIDLASWRPDCIVAIGGRVIPNLQKFAAGIPIIVPGASDPVGVGWVESLSRPGGNISGLTQIERSVFGKMMHFLSRTAPTRTRAFLVYNSDNPSWVSFFEWFEDACNELAIEPRKCPLTRTTLRRAIEATASQESLFFFCNDVTTASAFQAVDDAVLATGVPAIFADPPHAQGGGLLIYSADRIALARKAGHYVDRVLRGEPVSEMPFEQPNSYRLIVNLRTAEAINIKIPEDIVALADEVIE